MDLRENGVSEDATVTSDCMENTEEEEDYIIEDEDMSFKNE
jgi:hypothetical protein